MLGMDAVRIAVPRFANAVSPACAIFETFCDLFENLAKVGSPVNEMVQAFAFDLTEFIDRLKEVEETIKREILFKESRELQAVIAPFGRDKYIVDEIFYQEKQPDGKLLEVKAGYDDAVAKITHLSSEISRAEIVLARCRALLGVTVPEDPLSNIMKK